jgi:hypothetical protein
MRSRFVLFTALLCLLLGTTFSAAQPASPGAVSLQTSAEGVTLRWQPLPVAAAGTLPAPAAAVPFRFAAGEVPTRLIPLLVPGDDPVQLRMLRLESRPWAGHLPANSSLSPATPIADRPLLHAVHEPELPAAPLTVLREARMRGNRIVVIALSPLFRRGADLQAVTLVEATVPGAQPLQPSAAALLAGSGPFLQHAPAPWQPAGPAVKVLVRQAGLQRIPAGDLAAVGLDLSRIDHNRLWLRRAGQSLPLEIVGSAASSELRFYAPAPGDRWNAADVYWLVLESAAAPRISVRELQPGDAPPRATAFEEGTWRQSLLYDSTRPGPDGDHWFAADLRTGPNQPPAEFDFQIEPRLPAANGSTTLTVDGLAYTSGNFQLQAQLAAVGQQAEINGGGNWIRLFVLESTATSGVLRLLPAVAAGIEIDAVHWLRPATLDFGGQGAEFVGVAGEWHYQLRNLPAAAALYDVTDPLAPQRLQLSGAGFRDGPEARRYLLSGPATSHLPELRAFNPPLFDPQALDVVYIAPVELHHALQPLLDLRRWQGHAAALVDVAQIYDAWSFGAVAPTAIRDFLRYTATWPQPPRAVVLVGDGTSDPLDYTGRANPNLIPPFLASVDPWIGETACESCFGQLDGSDPLSDPLPDMAVGRLPVADADALAGLVAKMVRYETAAPAGAWRSRAIFLADNTDEAGDFAAFADQAIQRLPEGVASRRLYYDPQPSPLPWLEHDPLRARDRAIAHFSAGAALLTYTGHSNQWQWAVTGSPLQADQPADQQYLFGLFDADILANRDRLPMLLAMTCLSSAFQTPAFSGTSLDERLVLRPDGGVIAGWGSTGQGVAYGHESLQRGFLQALNEPSAVGELAALTTAGYLELFSTGGCCQDALRTFVLLGDPLTRLQIETGPPSIYLPLMSSP